MSARIIPFTHSGIKPESRAAGELRHTWKTAHTQQPCRGPLATPEASGHLYATEAVDWVTVLLGLGVFGAFAFFLMLL